MKTTRGVEALAWAAGCALLAACSEPTPTGGGPSGGRDASVFEASAAARADDGSTLGDLDADGAGDAGPLCATPCGGACVAGRCLVALAQVTAPVDLALDHASAYFASCPLAVAGAVLSVPLEGGSPTTLVPGPGCPTSLAVDDTSLYVAGVGLAGADGGVILRVPLDGGTVTTLVSGADRPVGIAVDGTSVYWTTSNALMRIPVAGGTPAALQSALESATRPVVVGGYVYWVDPSTGAIQRVPIDGGSASIVTAGAVSSLAIAGDDVFFAGGFTLMRAPVDGGASTVISTAGGAPVLALAVDDASVYFTSSSTIWKGPLGGGAAAIIASNQGEPGVIAVDATSVYWTNGTSWPPPPAGGSGGGQIMKLTPK
jgi:hypothetical protein